MIRKLAWFIIKVDRFFVLYVLRLKPKHWLWLERNIPTRSRILDILLRIHITGR